MDSSQDLAKQDAARWFARLRAPDCTAVERAEFEKWLASEPHHAAAFAAAERMAEALSKLAMIDPRLKQMVDQAAGAGATLPDDEEPAPPPKPTSLTISAVPTPVGKRRRLARPFAWAASIGATFVAVPLLLTLDSADEQAADGAALRYHSGSARSTVTLDDGTRVYLDVASTIDVHFDAAHRTVTLRHGRALFETAYEVARPFVVNVDGKRVTALGTMFQVEYVPAEVVVTLLHGVATVASQSDALPIALAAGEELRSSPSTTRSSKRNIDVEAATVWSAEERATQPLPRGKLAFGSAVDPAYPQQF
jgi:transmembrane sensor